MAYVYLDPLSGSQSKGQIRILLSLLASLQGKYDPGSMTGRCDHWMGGAVFRYHMRCLLTCIRPCVLTCILVYIRPCILTCLSSCLSFSLIGLHHKGYSIEQVGHTSQEQ